MPDPEQATPEAAAYAVLAPELPGTTPESIKGVYMSKIDKSWASVRFEPEDEVKPFVVFAHRDGSRGRPRSPSGPTSPTTPKTTWSRSRACPRTSPIPLRGERVRGRSV